MADDELSFLYAVKVAGSRIEAEWTAMEDQMSALWRTLEPMLRDFVANGDPLTEREWMEIPEAMWHSYLRAKALIATHGDA